MKTIAVIVGNNQSRYIEALMSGFCKESKRRGVRLVFFTEYRVPNILLEGLGDDYDPNNDYQFSSIYSYVKYSGCDGCIFCMGSVNDTGDLKKEEEFLRICGLFPTVILETPTQKMNIPYLVVDGYSAQKEIVTHLVKDHGYKKIAFLSGPKNNYGSMKRFEAYSDVLQENGIKFKESLVAYGDYSEQVEELVNKLIDENDDLDAICAANDNMAKACYKVCRERGLVIGEDIAITGFDDISIASLMKPGLTTASYNLNDFASKAMDMIIELIETDNTKSYEYPVEMVVRNSCGCKKCISDSNIKDISCLLDVDDVENYNISKDDLVRAVDYEARDNKRLKVQSWLISFFARDLIENDITENEYIKLLFKKLKAAHVNNSYIFLHNAVIDCNANSIYDFSGPMCFVGGFNDEFCHSVSKERWYMNKVNVRNGFADFLPNKQGTFQSYVLFSGSEIYGIMLCEADSSQKEFLLDVSLQIGNLFHYLKIKTIEEKIHEEMKLSIERVKETNQILSVISRYDELTKILNRRGFMEQSLALISRRKGKEALLLFADLDHLKEINDCFGHADGDYAICSAANMLTGLMPRDGFCARMGGDEFLGFIPVPSGESSEKLKNELKDKFKEAMFAFNIACEKPYFIELSVGFYSFVCDENVNFADVMAHSDEVLYEDKQSRRKSIKKYNDREDNE